MKSRPARVRVRGCFASRTLGLAALGRSPRVALRPAPEQGLDLVLRAGARADELAAGSRADAVGSWRSGGVSESERISAIRPIARACGRGYGPFVLRWAARTPFEAVRAVDRQAESATETAGPEYGSRVWRTGACAWAADAAVAVNMAAACVSVGSPRQVTPCGDTRSSVGFGGLGGN
jgi:hypothetical protein